MSITVFTDGVFDLFHANHAAFLSQASALGDRLVVGVIGDEVTQSYKRIPIIPQAERLAIVQSIACVADAFIIDAPLTADTMDKIVSDYDISVVVYAGDSTPEFYTNAEAVGIMRRLPYRDGVNTTQIIDRLKYRP